MPYPTEGQDTQRLCAKGKLASGIREAKEEFHTHTKPAFFWSCFLSHTNSRYRLRTHEVLAVKALLLVCETRCGRKGKVRGGSL